jgi:hypothetical protein
MPWAAQVVKKLLQEWRLPVPHMPFSDAVQTEERSKNRNGGLDEEQIGKSNLAWIVFSSDPGN